MRRWIAGVLAFGLTCPSPALSQVIRAKIAPVTPGSGFAVSAYLETRSQLAGPSSFFKLARTEGYEMSPRYAQMMRSAIPVAGTLRFIRRCRKNRPKEI